MTREAILNSVFARKRPNKIVLRSEMMLPAASGERENLRYRRDHMISAPLVSAWRFGCDDGVLASTDTPIVYRRRLCHYSLRAVARSIVPRHPCRLCKPSSSRHLGARNQRNNNVREMSAAIVCNEAACRPIPQ